MRINARSSYSLLAAIELARCFPGDKPVRVADLSARIGVPENFLIQILQSLRNGGVVESVRGAGGGFRLACAPVDLSVGKVLRAAQSHGGYVQTSSFADHAMETSGSPELNRAVGYVLSEAERALARVFDTVTLAMVLERALARDFVPDYQI
jgi:Rrf2 family protein